MPIVFPANQRRQRHQDGFGAAARLQAEQCASIVNQIEFDIAAPPVELKLPLAIAVRLVLAAFQNGHECRQKMLTDAALKSKGTVKSAFVQIVEEQAADTAGLVSMRQEKVAIAPLLVFLIESRAERYARVPRGSMPMEHILVVGVVRREVEAAAEPPDFRARERPRHQEPDIAMRGGRMRISRVKYQRQAHRLEGRACDIRTQVRRGWRHLLAEHMRDRHSRALEYGAIAQYAAFAAAAFGPNPSVAAKSHCIGIFHRRGDAILQIDQVALYRGCVCRVSHYDFFAGLFFLALGLFLPFGLPFDAADGTGARLLTADFLPFAASFTGAAAAFAAAAFAAAAVPAAPWAALAPLTPPLGANFEPFPPLRPHMPRFC